MKALDIKPYLCLLIFLTVSCVSTPTCEEYADILRSDSAQLIVTKQNIGGRTVKLAGYDLRTGKEVEYRQGGGHFIPLIGMVSIGDTFSKQAGETDYLIRKTKLNLVLRYYCDKPSNLETLPK